MKRKSPSFHLGTGSSFILMIFVLLCLVVFAVLSLVSANADWKLGDRLAQRTAAYYEASQRGKERLEELDRQLAALYQEAENLSAYRDACRSWLSSLDGTLEEGTEAGAFLFSFQEEITDQQHLAVTVQIPMEPAAGESFYQIKAWQTEASQAWEPDNSLDLIEY